MAQFQLDSPHVATRWCWVSRSSSGIVRTGAALAMQGRHASATVYNQNGQRPAAALPQPHLRCSSATRLLWAPSSCSRAAVSCARRSRTSICAKPGWQGQQINLAGSPSSTAVLQAKQVCKHVCREPKPRSQQLPRSFDCGHLLLHETNMASSVTGQLSHAPTPRSCSCLSSAAWAARSARMASMSCTGAARSRGQCFCRAQQAALQV